MVLSRLVNNLAICLTTRLAYKSVQEALHNAPAPTISARKIN